MLDGRKLGITEQVSPGVLSTSTQNTSGPGNVVSSGNGLQSPAPPTILDLKKNAMEAAARPATIQILNVNVPHLGNNLWYFNKVRPFGEWDYKNSFGRTYEDFGNYNYGITAKSAGYNIELVQRMAGAVQQSTNLAAPITSMFGIDAVKTKGTPWGEYPYGDAFENGHSYDQEFMVNGYYSNW